MVGFGERAVYVEAEQERHGAMRVPAQQAQALQEPHPAGLAARSAGATAQGSSPATIWHMAVSPPSHLRTISTNSKSFYYEKN